MSEVIDVNAKLVTRVRVYRTSVKMQTNVFLVSMSVPIILIALIHVVHTSAHVMMALTKLVVPEVHSNVMILMSAL